MYLFVLRGGEIRRAPQDFNPAAPDFAALADVEHVLHVDKILVKELKLVVLPKEQRDAIRQRLSAAGEQPPVPADVPAPAQRKTAVKRD